MLVLLASLTAAPQKRPALADCARTPAKPRADSTRRARPTPWLDSANRIFQKAYPNLKLIFRDSLYVVDNGTAYGVRMNYDDDKDSGFAALVLTYKSRHDAALETGEKLNGDGCRSPMELVLARVDSTGSVQIIARGQLDDEASAIDIRTIDVDFEDGEPTISLMYFAYYGRPGWFGFVGWRSSVGLERGKLIGQRLPASYLKLSRPEQRMEGYLAPAGGDPAKGTARLETAAFGTSGQIEKQFDVPLKDRRWISGVDILSQVP